MNRVSTLLRRRVNRCTCKNVTHADKFTIVFDLGNYLVSNNIIDLSHFTLRDYAFGTSTNHPVQVTSRRSTATGPPLKYLMQQSRMMSKRTMYPPAPAATSRAAIQMPSTGISVQAFMLTRHTTDKQTTTKELGGILKSRTYRIIYARPLCPPNRT